MIIIQAAFGSNHQGDIGVPSSPGAFVQFASKRLNVSGLDKIIQTEMTCLQIQNTEAKAQSDLEKKNMAISDLERVSTLISLLEIQLAMLPSH